MSKHEIETLDLASISDNGQNGYILEVDMEYPKELHDDLHNDYTLAPEVAVNSKHFIFELMVGVKFQNIANVYVLSTKLDTLNEIMKIKVLLTEI